jgi:HlyD family secretion protein
MTIPSLFKKKKTYIWSAVVILIFWGGYSLFRSKPAVTKTVNIQTGDIEQVISATGQVSSNDKVDLSFDHSGKVINVSGVVGNNVYSGQILARLDSADLLAQSLSADANYQSAIAKYNQLVGGAKKEDIEVLSVSLANAQKILSDLKSKNVIDTVKTSMNVAINSLVTILDPQISYYGMSEEQKNTYNQESEIALFQIYGQHNLINFEISYFLSLNGGLKEVINKIDSTINFDADKLVSDVRDLMTHVQKAVDSAYIGATSTANSDTLKTLVSTAKTNVLTQLAAISTQQQSLLTAENNVSNAQAQLNLKIAPPTQYDIDIAQSLVTQAKASQAQIQAQLEKNILRSPIAGVIANVDLNVGENVSPSKIVATIIGRNKFQIESNIPEVDVAKIKVGDPVKVTLDAYGPDIVWDATVTQIYQIENVIEGVPTYKTVFTLNKEDDRIKSGMTTNLEISNDKRTNVLFLPQRTIIRRDGKKFVKLLSADGVNSSEIQIQTGLYGSDGRVEILSGLKEGDKIVTE